MTFDPSAEISPREIADAVKQTVGVQEFGSTAVHIGGGAAIPQAINTRSAKIWGQPDERHRVDGRDREGHRREPVQRRVMALLH